MQEESRRTSQEQLDHWDALYEEVAVNSFRYFGMKTLDEVDNMTIKEYRLHAKAMGLDQLDKQYWAHWQAFLNFAVKAEKRAGKGKTKPVYSTFSKFFDYQKLKDEVEGKKQESTITSRLRQYMKMKGGGENGKL